MMEEIPENNITPVSTINLTQEFDEPDEIKSSKSTENLSKLNENEINDNIESLSSLESNDDSTRLSNLDETSKISNEINVEKSEQKENTRNFLISLSDDSEETDLTQVNKKTQDENYESSEIETTKNLDKDVIGEIKIIEKDNSILAIDLSTDSSTQENDDEQQQINIDKVETNFEPKLSSDNKETKENEYNKINGDYINENLSLNSIINDENSCSSTNSSASSTNLVIDQQEPPDKPSPKNSQIEKNLLNFEPNSPQKLIIANSDNNLINKNIESESILNTEQINNISHNNEILDDLTNPLKRKLSFSDTDDLQVQNKIYHVDQSDTAIYSNNTSFVNPNKTISNDEINTSLVNSIENDSIDSKITLFPEKNQNNFDKNIDDNSNSNNSNNNKKLSLLCDYDNANHIRNENVEQLNGENVADNPKLHVKDFEYKCFKCLSVNYETLTELRDHQKMCLFRDNSSYHRHHRSLNSSSSSSSSSKTLTTTTATNDSLKNFENSTNHIKENQSIQKNIINDEQRFQNLQQIQQYSILQPPLIQPFSIIPPQASLKNVIPILNQDISNVTQSILPLIPTETIPVVELQIQTATKTPTMITKLQKNCNLKKSPERKKYFLCSACGTYHQNWNLFLHMREKHKRHICLYCLGMFPTAEHLTLHLEMKHDMEQNHFDCQEKLLRSSRDPCFLMCCTCEHIFPEHEEFSEHKCVDYMLPCSLCGLKGKHTITCKASSNSGSGKRQKDRTKNKLLINNNNNNNKNIGNKIKSIKSQINCNVNNNNNYNNNNNNNNNQLDKAFNNINATIKNIIDFKSTINQKSNRDNKKNKICKLQQGSTDKDDTKPNGFIEHGNFDYDLINLYKSNRMAILKQKQIQEEKQLNQIEKNSQTIEKQNPVNIFNSDYNNFTINSINDHNNDKFNQENFYNDDYNNSTILKNSTSILENRLTLQSPQKQMQKEFIELNNDELQQDQQQQHQHEQLTKLIVPKFKLKIPKQYQAPLVTESDQSSSSNEIDNKTINKKIIKSVKRDKKEIAQKAKQIENLKNQISIEKNMENSINNDSDMDIDITCTSNESFIPIPLQIKQDFSPTATNETENDYFTAENSTIKTNETNDNKNNQISNDQNNGQFLIPPIPPPALPIDNLPENSPSDLIEKTELTAQIEQMETEPSTTPEPILFEKPRPSDGIDLADDDIQILELSLDDPLDKIQMVKFLRICLKATFSTCLYCNHARRIAVNGNSLALHILALHRFSATVDSITAEELLPTTIVMKLKSFLNDLNPFYFNMNDYCNINQNENSIVAADEKFFECFQCRFATSIHKELYLHNRKMHLRTAILCFMCRSNFYSYSEVLCHICPGSQDKVIPFDIKFRCCLCDLDEIPSAFRLMVHLRKKHFACDVCLEHCHDQSRLSSHVWKHKLHHLCYRCGIAYRNKPDITKHLFWKHGTESVLCKRCLQKRWPHVYHFCIPPQFFICEICNLSFSRAMYLKVHKRLHSGDAPYPCTEDNCDKKFISRKLLLKHVDELHTIPEVKTIELLDENNAMTTNTNQIKDETIELNIKSDDNNKHSNGNNIENTNKIDVESKTINDKSTNDLLETPVKKKKKKSKRENKESLEDLNLQAPNLSESDSSDESDLEKPIKTTSNEFVPNVMLSPSSDGDDENDAEIKIDTNAGKILDIWENFKSFQAQHSKPDDDDEINENNIELPIPILHVAQSDHDYCLMFRSLINDKKLKNNDNDTTQHVDGEDEFKKFINSSSNSQNMPTKQKKQKSPRKAVTKTNNGSSSSSDSSSSSNSSCSCGSNCSCSSSSDSSSDSSSSSDESVDSSSSEGKRRIAAKRAAKKEKKMTKNSITNNTISENVDVETNDIKSEEILAPINLEPIFLECDLETDESDTDEEFYDNHPQKLASELLAEKRRLLMQQTSLSPSHNFDIVENSRPSTPSLPEEIVNSEKKQKLKKKKRERKASSKNIIPPFKLNIPPAKFTNSGGKKSKLNKLTTNNRQYGFSPTNAQVILNNNIKKPFMSPGIIDLLPPANLMASAGTPESIHAITPPPPQAIQLMAQHHQAFALNSTSVNVNTSVNHLNTAAPINTAKYRLSTGSSSDADGSLKRSKRARRPNRFYGYSSDDETPQHLQQNHSFSGGSGVFKPTPPPVLTWCKEDLPSPSKSILSHKNFKSPQVQGGNNSLSQQTFSTKKTTGSSSVKRERQKPKKENASKSKKITGKLLLSNTSTPKSSLLSNPPIPTLKIRPSAILPQSILDHPPSILDHPQTQYSYRQQPAPPVVASEPLIRVPPVPVHHIEPPSMYTSSRDSVDSSDTSDDDKLTIPVTSYKTPKIKNKSPKSTTAKPNSKKSIKLSLSHTTPITASTTICETPPQSSQTIQPTTVNNPPPAVASPAIVKRRIPPALIPNPDASVLQYLKRNNIRYPIRPPDGARSARDGESVYCYCRCPYDEVSEMIACDGNSCMIEWFHFECVGIFVAPVGTWYCAECKPKYQLDNYQHLSAASASANSHGNIGY